jgi:hypothetical protein
MYFGPKQVLNCIHLYVYIQTRGIELVQYRINQAIEIDCNSRFFFDVHVLVVGITGEHQIFYVWMATVAFPPSHPDPLLLTDLVSVSLLLLHVQLRSQVRQDY